MSTTFEVYPRSSMPPSFRELLTLANQRLHEQLAVRGVHTRPTLCVSVRTGGTHEHQHRSLDAPATWARNSLAALRAG